MTVCVDKVGNLDYDELLSQLKNFNKTLDFDDEQWLQRADKFKVTRSMLRDLQALYGTSRPTKVRVVMDPISKKRCIREVAGPVTSGLSTCV